MRGTTAFNLTVCSTYEMFLLMYPAFGSYLIKFRTTIDTIQYLGKNRHFPIVVRLRLPSRIHWTMSKVSWLIIALWVFSNTCHLEGSFHNGWSTNKHCICQVLTKFHDFKICNIMYPSSTVKDKPLLTFRYISCDFFEHISEESAIADITTSVSSVFKQVEFSKFWKNAVEVLTGSCNHRTVKCRTFLYCLCERNHSVSRSTLNSVPLVTHKSRSSEKPVHLLGITTTP